MVRDRNRIQWCSRVCTGWVLSLCVIAAVLAVVPPDSDALTSQSKRLTLDNYGVTIDYVYDEDGNLIEERSSDGSVIYHPVDDETN